MVETVDPALPTTACTTTTTAIVAAAAAGTSTVRVCRRATRIVIMTPEEIDRSVPHHDPPGCGVVKSARPELDPSPRRMGCPIRRRVVLPAPSRQANGAAAVHVGLDQQPARRVDTGRH